MTMIRLFDSAEAGGENVDILAGREPELQKRAPRGKFDSGSGPADADGFAAQLLDGGNRRMGGQFPAPTDRTSR